MLSMGDEWVPKIVAWEFHWWFKEAVRNNFNANIASPLPSRTYLCHDFKDPDPLTLAFPWDSMPDRCRYYPGIAPWISLWVLLERFRPTVS